ncbi:hypothetical protein ACA910_017154 [Epithemia clementina (nom. ined.)]
MTPVGAWVFRFVQLHVALISAFSPSRRHKETHQQQRHFLGDHGKFLICRPSATTPLHATLCSDGSIDPLLINALIGDETDAELNHYVFRSLTNISYGIHVWRAAINKGRLPLLSEFPAEQPWPDEPLFSKILDVMVLLQLPRFAQRHPEVVTSMLLSVVRLSVQFMAVSTESEQEEGSVDNHVLEYVDMDDDSAETSFARSPRLSVEAMAEEFGNAFVEEWSSVVGGVGILDQMFGLDHGLLRVESESSKDSVSTGFGLDDGIWKHSGWKFIPEYQRQLSSMPELRKLVRDLGRRPTAENRDRMHKFKARKRNREGGMGAEKDPQSRESVSGITRSSNLAEMLPSEAVLLRSSIPTLRQLFLQKRAESKLLSYELSGWTDIPSVPLTRPLRMERMPCAPGGPIIVCLDTSWSMSSLRENLSKAAVLACVSAAHSQRRDCQVIAFSTERNVIEATSLSANADGIQSLLNFLSNSFGGGTDVTGALKFAIDALDSDIMSAADILLVTDGEIPDPPVSQSMMESLDFLKLRKGVEVHGLLVGKSESNPLSRLCTKVHNFLNGYDMFAPSRGSSLTRLNGIASRVITRTGYDPHLPRLGWHCFGARLRHVPLRARRSVDSEDDWDRKSRRVRRSKSQNSEGFDNGDDDNGESEENSSEASFHQRADDALESLKASANDVVSREVWSVDILDKEKQAIGSCWKYRDELRLAIDRVGEGLVERSVEARLVVLALLATEHILLLGVPGTGKSVLGRRLSVLCNGSFFQRLLTRFTTPEELFGPLSLRSLENDEYRRVTAGYLPSASVAFLDEIFKSNSSILNTLLTILNERKFDNAGGQEECPIRCVVGASNELPDSDELIALYDRFLLRKDVLPVSDEGLLKLLSMSNPGGSMSDKNGNECGMVFSDGLDHIVAALSLAADTVTMDRNACELMRDLRTFIRDELNIDISDRRLVKASRLLKISAACHGRSRVDPIDCMILQHCVWQVPEQRAAIKEWLWDNITPSSSSDGTDSVAQLRFLLAGLRQEILWLVRRTNGDVTGNSGARQDEVAALKSLAVETARLVKILQEKRVDLARHSELLHQSNELLWMDPDETQAMKQLLLPRVSAIAAEVEKTLLNAVALQHAIEKPDIVPNECRLSVIENLWDEMESQTTPNFTDKELQMSMKEAKANFDGETFRKWKRARKKIPI